MRKSLLVTLDFPPDIGGVARYYNNLISRLPTDNILVLAPPRKAAAELNQNQNYKIIRKNLLSRSPFIWPRWFSLITQLKKIITQEKIEVVLVGQVLPIGNAVYYLQRLKKVPYIIFTHGLDITLPQANKRRSFILKKFLNSANRVVANSQFTKGELLKLGIPAEKIEVLTPGCDLIDHPADSKLVEQIRQRHNLEAKKVLLTMGRLEERKGHDRVIQALGQLRDRLPDLVYMIVGSGKDETRLRKLALEEKITERVIFTGSISEAERSAYYQLSDVFIMPARKLANQDVEGFGIVFLEAGAYAKPVIGGLSGGISEAIIAGQTGLIVNPDDVKAISGAIAKLISEPEFAQTLGRYGQQRVQQEFRWETRAQKLEQIIDSI